MWRCLIVLLLSFGGSIHLASGQNVVFTAVAGANKMGTKEQVQVQYTIRDAQNLQSVTNPSDADFIIVGGPYQSQSSSMQVINGHAVSSSSISLTYVLQPRREGTFTIPPVTARDAEGHAYQSNAITIQVVPGTTMQQQQPQRRARAYDPFADADDDVMALMRQMQAMQQQQMQAMQQQGRRAQPPQQQQQRQQVQQDPPVNEDEIKKDLFIRVTADRNKVHIGEQVTISYKLYSRIPMQMAISKLPSLNGFWTQDFDIPKQVKPTEEVLDGKKYQVFLLKKSALFPQQTGVLELDPAEAKGSARIVQQVRRRMADMLDPFGNGTLMMNDPFFNNAFYNTMAYKDVPVHLRSTPVKITVTALPEKDKPAQFSGAVGKFTLSSKIDKKQLTTDEVATITLSINGSGNLKLIEAPTLNLPNGLNTYDPVVIDTITGRSTTISGSKIITYVITPQSPGDYEVPPIPFNYYDAEKDRYVTEYTETFKLHVTPGKHAGANRSDAAGVSYKDIHDIVKQAPRALSAHGAPLLFRPFYWVLFLLPLVAFLLFAALRRRDEERSKDSVSLRRKRANKVALQRLATAKKLLQDNTRRAFYEEVSKAIWLYLSDKLSIPLSGLSRESAATAMSARNIPADIQKRLDDVIWECETALYASGGARTMTHTYDDAVKVISNLEDVFKS